LIKKNVGKITSTILILIVVPLYSYAIDVQHIIKQGDQYFKKAQFSEALKKYNDRCPNIAGAGAGCPGQCSKNSAL